MNAPNWQVREQETSPKVARAMKSARAAQAVWSRIPVASRLLLVRELRGILVQNASMLAEASASARKRPSLECLTSEVLPLVEACRFLEREASRLLAPRSLGKRDRPLWLAGVSSEIHREPFGVILIIGPGNYPLFLAGVQLIQSLVAGNAVLLKPGVGGSEAACLLKKMIVRSGFDPQLIALLPESTEAAQAAVLAGPDKVLFTGAASTGEIILSQLAPRLVPSVMELSGCDAVVIRADADLDLAVKAIVFGLEINNGATCMAPKRVFIADSIASRFERQLAKTLDSLRKENHGSQSGGDVLACRVIDRKLRMLLDDALDLGARFISGEMHEGGMIRSPIVLSSVVPEARILNEDVFAPVLSIVAVANDQEAVMRVNRCPYALTASIFTCDERAARGLASRINAGVVTINDLIVPTAEARLPFGGRKRSGFGVTRGGEGLLELTVPKVITVSKSRRRPAFDPSSRGDENLFLAYLELTHSRGIKLRWTALLSLFKSLITRHKLTKNKTI